MANLLEIIENGNFQGLGKPDRIIETLISKLFFFGDKVYKVYKYDKAFFGDFSDPIFRRSFYQDDFIWNHAMASDVYLELGQTATSDDFFILMNKIDDSKTLFNLIKKGNLTLTNLELVTEEMFKRMEKLTELKKMDMKDRFDMPYTELDPEELESTRQWLYLSPDLIPKSEGDLIIDTLKAFVTSHPFFKSFDKKRYLASIDNHSGNIIFSDGRVNFIDSMPPMRIWRVQSDVYAMSRPATDFEVLLGKKYADAMFAKFEQIRDIKVDPKVRAYFQTVAAIIQAPYMHVLGEDEYAQKFWNFAKEKVKEIR